MRAGPTALAIPFPQHGGNSGPGTHLDFVGGMLEPTTPIERIPPSRFRPPFCPNPDCPDHRPKRTGAFRFWRDGSYRRKCDRRRVPRFRCCRCGGGFSARTFAVTYRMRRPDLLLTVARWMTSGAALRPIGRAYNDRHPDRACHPSTIARIARRVGVQALLLLEEVQQRSPPLTEKVVFDHFVSFVGLQENGLELATPIGDSSAWVYGLRPAWRRQATNASKKKRQVASIPNDLDRSVDEVLDLLLARVPESGTLHLVSDAHPGYRKAIGRHRRRHAIRHEVHANPLARGEDGANDDAAWQRDRALRRNDRLHTLIRHLAADHRRETIAFCRRGEALVERMAALAAWHNLAKPVSIRRNDTRTPGMLRGLTPRPWIWAEILAKRRFASHLRLDATMRRVVERRLRDPRGVVWPDRARMRSV